MVAVAQTDCEFLLEILADGEQHTLNEILGASFERRGCGLTVHSRAADLRKQGHMIVNEKVQGAERGFGSAYRLISPDDRRPLVEVEGTLAVAPDDQLDLGL